VNYTFDEFLSEGRGVWVPVQSPRPLNEDERRLIEAMLAEPFPGHDQLQRQVPSVRVLAHGPNGDPSIKMSPTRDPTQAANIGARGRIPVEARGTDVDGREVTVYLHVIEGYLGELEVIGESGRPAGLPVLEGLEVY
jgi:hypothetical protein